jgi:hypothetical protein
MKMKYLLVSACVLLAAPAYADSKNFGKADDYGTERWAMDAQCLAQLAAHEIEGDITSCMEANGFKWLPNARVFGNDGPKCKNDKEWGHYHSWCWWKEGADVVKEEWGYAK